MTPGATDPVTRPRRYVPVLALGFTLLAVAGSAKAPFDRASGLAIENVSVVDVRAGEIRDGRTVVVEGDRIVEVAPASDVSLSEGVARVDGSGRYLIPGLWDMHVHAYGYRDDPERLMRIGLAYGVTGVRDMGATPAVFERLRKWRRRVRAGETPGPRLYLAGVIVDGVPPTRPHYLTASDPTEAREAVDSLRRMGADLVKVYGRLSPAAFHAIAEEADRQGLEFSGHWPRAVGPGAAAEAGITTIEHVDDLGFRLSTIEPLPVDAYDSRSDYILSRIRAFARYDEAKADSLIDRFVANGTIVVPTIHSVYALLHQGSDHLPEGPIDGLLPESQSELANQLPTGVVEKHTKTYDRAYRNLERLLKQMYEAGVVLMAGSHAPAPFVPPGLGLHEELERFSEAGLGPAEALRTATLHPARYMGRLNELGTVEEGKLADLVLLDANPLEDITHTREIAAVVVDGRYLDRGRLDRLLADAERAAHPRDAARDSVPAPDRSPTEGGREAQVPRTRTFPALAEAPYPYARPEDAGLAAERLEALGDRVAGWVRDSSIVGTEILVVKDRKIVLHEAIGWSDRAAGEPMRRNSIYRIRSMTKPFTGTAALMLVEEGKLALDSPVARWLPSWGNERSGEVTVRQLLTHTAGWVQGGLPDDVRTYPSLRAAVDAAGETGPQHRPGEAFRYSDVHSYTLGALVAEVTGMPVERFLEERILEPLDLEDTHTRFAPDTSWADRMNPTYRWEDSVWYQYWHPDSDQVHPFFRASGGLYSTVFDYARWMDAWMQWAGLVDGPEGEEPPPRLLSEATARQALAPSEIGSYGFHWDIESLDPLVFEHGGSDGTLATAIPSRGTMLLFFTQSRGNETRGEWSDAALEAVLPDVELRRPVRAVSAAEAGLTPVPIPARELERYAGAYIYRGDTLTFTVEGGRLRGRELPRPLVTLDGRSVPRFTLVPIGDRTFAFGRYEAGDLVEVFLPRQWLRFEVEEGEVVGLRPGRGEEAGPYIPKVR